MENCLNRLQVLHFADDSTIHFKFNGDISGMVNNELDGLQNWLNANKLFLNVSKTKYMIFNNRKRPADLSIQIGNSTIERTQVHKFLGVYIDEQLIFKDHTKNLCSKISKGVGLLRRIKDFIPKQILRQLHYTLIHSKFTYAITTFGTANQNAIQKLVNLINKSLKAITGSRCVTPDLCKTEKTI